MASQLDRLNQRIASCRLCDRLLAHCRLAAQHKRAAYRHETYHGGPIGNFGDPQARLLIVGLAPGAHGANRTGRMFTGDRSGQLLYRVLHEAGFANQAESMSRQDGLVLQGAMISGAVHCAPPANKPTAAEIAHCRPYLDQTFQMLEQLQVVTVLGRLACTEVLRYYRRRGWIDKLAACPFAHGAVHEVADAPLLVCSYHPSQQNTFTGRLTHRMLLAVFHRARAHIDRAAARVQRA